MIKFCQKCFENHINQFGCCNGYYWCLNDDVNMCSECGSELLNIDFPALDLKILTKISNEPKFYQSMIELHDKDIIEYELKMSQFRSQVEANKHANAIEKNIPKCPTCQSTNIRKIGTGERAVSILGFGILSKKINKTWKCNDCGHTW